jgi:ribosome-associated protein
MTLEEKTRTANENARVIEALKEKHALDLTLIDMSAVSGFADTFIIATARSDINAKALLDAATDALDIIGVAYRVEGETSARWRLVDAGNLIIHIFSKSGREFYKLERLWGDAPITMYDDEE